MHPTVAYIQKYRLNAKAAALLPWLIIAAGTYLHGRIAYLEYIHLHNGIDLGTYTQILHNLTSGHAIPPYNSLLGKIAWGDHAHFIVAALVPVYALFPHPLTLLAVQVLAITTAGWPIYQLAIKKLRNTFFAAAILIAYLLFFGIQYAVEFDFHANVLTAALFAWLVWAAYTRRWLVYWPLLLATCLTRWNPSGIPLAYLDIHTDSKNPLSLAAAIVGDPVTTIQNMTDTSVKVRTLKNTFAAFAWLPLTSPLTYLASLPNLLARFLSPEDQRWAMKLHYSASLASILPLGAVLGLAALTAKLSKNHRRAVTSLAAVALLYATFAVSLRDSDLPIHKLANAVHTNPEKFEHLRLSILSHLDQIIPANDSVSAMSSFVPALSRRERIYYFPQPLPKAADWVVLGDRGRTWPLPKGEVLDYIKEYSRDPRYETVWNKYGIFAFKRRAAE